MERTWSWVLAMFVNITNTKNSLSEFLEHSVRSGEKAGNSQVAGLCFEKQSGCKFEFLLVLNWI